MNAEWMKARWKTGLAGVRITVKTRGRGTSMLLLLTNDDGIEAPGIRALWRAAEPLGRCRIIAPSGPISGCGHQTTTHQPIVIDRRAGDAWAIGGTPVDCVRLALHTLAPKPDWVLSGINAGGNLGTDVYHSGTVAAVREAAIRGHRGIAISHYIARGRPIDWDRAAAWAAGVLARLMAMPCDRGTFWNVNLPHPAPGGPDPEVVFCPLDPSPLPLDYRYEGTEANYSGDYQARARRAGSDVEVCFGGSIAVTLVRLLGATADSPA
jgi:5'-nucleotidase